MVYRAKKSLVSFLKPSSLNCRSDTAVLKLSSVMDVGLAAYR